MVKRLIDQLNKTGIRSVTVITGWLGEQVEAHVQSLADSFPELELSVTRETRRLGNIGGLGQLPPTEKNLLFLFADLVTDMDFSSLVAAHLAGDADITLASHLDPYQLSFGELEVDGARVTKYIEKPVKHTLICSGVAVLRPSAVALIPAGRPMGIADLVTVALREGMRVAHRQHQAFWIDVNSEAALRNAERAVSGRDIV
jgi:NDP-sugar pyrophosphorylase family protein